jgi:hypothetical protein
MSGRKRKQRKSRPAPFKCKWEDTYAAKPKPKDSPGIVYVGPVDITHGTVTTTNGKVHGTVTTKEAKQWHS